MIYGQRIAQCHFAALKDDVIPPDPRLCLHRVSPTELAISLGSLAFIRPPKALKPDNTEAVTAESDAPEEGNNDNEGKCSNQRTTNPRKTEVLLKVSLFKDGELVSDRVAIRLNRNQLFGYREIALDKDEPTGFKVKHRNTYVKSCSHRLLTGHARVNCKLLVRKGKACAFRLKGLINCRRKLYGTSDADDSSWFSAITDSLERLIPISARDNYDRKHITLQKVLRKSCKICLGKLPPNKHRIKFPFIVRVDTILRFQLWKRLKKSTSTLTMRNELYIDGQCVAESDADVAPLRSSVKGVCVMFHETAPGNSATPDDCNMVLCCCSSEKRLICSSHIDRMWEEIKRLFQTIFTCNFSSSANVMGRYRYLLYLYLQVMLFSNTNTLRCCGDNVPLAVLSIGVVEFSDEKCLYDVKDGKKILRNKGITHPKRQSPPDTSSEGSDDCNSDDSGLGRNEGTRVEQYFESAEAYYAKYHRRHKVTSVYLGPTFRERVSVLRYIKYVSATKPPIHVIPNKVEFLSSADCYQDEYIICPSLIEILTLHSNMYTANAGIAFIPEPQELLFLNSLICTPLYSVANYSSTADNKEVRTSSGSISYSDINKLLWKYVPLLSRSGETLPTFLRFVNWKLEKEASDALKAMQSWESPDIITLMELLSLDFLPPNVPEDVQQHACDLLVSSFTVEELMPFFPQILVAPGAKHMLDRLVAMSCNYYHTAMKLHWVIECWGKYNRFYSTVLENFFSTLGKTQFGEYILSGIKAQRKFRQRISIIMRHIRTHGHGYASEKSLKLLELLRSKSKLEVFHGLRPRARSNTCGRIIFDERVPLLTEPAFFITEVDTASCKIIKTSRYPLYLTLYVADERYKNADATAFSESYTPPTSRELEVDESEMFVKHVMYKDGDDLRLDHVCQHIIKFADVIIRKHGLESYIKTYEITSTSPRDGFVEIITDAKAISAILNEEGSIEAYLIDEGTSAIDALTKKINFVGSLASYSAITHVLGVGDRHNDNIILCKSGNLVHVDYGYILGLEPKLLPGVPFKLCKEFVDYLGGYDSHFYTIFKDRFYLVFSILRKHAKFIITLVYLLVDECMKNVNLSSIVDMESRFMLTVHDHALLRKHTDCIIECSAASLTTEVAEKMHQFSMWWK